MEGSRHKTGHFQRLRRQLPAQIMDNLTIDGSHSNIDVTSSCINSPK